MHRISILLLALSVMGFQACGFVEDGTTEDWETARQSATKGSGGAIGDNDFCSDPANPCLAGEGDCDFDSDCEGALVCGQNNGDDFGYADWLDFCWGAHCTNGIADFDETGVDCGGSCGFCPTEREGSNGDLSFCDDPAFPCDVGEGDCDVDEHCVGSLVCGQNNGDRFGFPASTDFCWGSHCTNGTKDEDETAIDCGGSCGPCIRSGSNGEEGYCDDPNFPCGTGEGDCDVDAHCQIGLVCGLNNGAAFGFEETVDVCVPSSCTNGVLDGNEDAIDCGGECGQCTRTGQNGDSDYCDNPAYPCVPGEGDCDFDSHCAGDAVCGQNTGERWGFPASTDVCQALHCNNGVLDGDEREIDCGGSCGACSVFSLGSTEFDAVRAVVAVPDGGVIIGGLFGASIDFGDGSPISPLGSRDGYLVRLDSLNRVQWKLSVASTLFDEVTLAESTGTGSVIVAGLFSGSADVFGQTLVSAGSTDIFLAEVAEDGNVLWVNGFGGSGTENLLGLSVSGGGEIAITGEFQGTTDLGGGSLTSAGFSDVFVAKYSPTGSHLWSNSFGGASADYAGAVAVDSSDNVWITGAFFGSVDYGGGALTSAGSADAYVVKFDSGGSHLSSQRFGGLGVDVGRTLKSDGGGGVYFGGAFSDVVDFLGKSLVSVGGKDMFVANIASDFSVPWVNRLGGNGADELRRIEVAPNGSLLVAGIYAGAGTEIGTGRFSSVGGFDAFTTNYAADGTYLGGTQLYRGGPDDWVEDMSFLSDGSAVVVGYFRSSGTYAQKRLTADGTKSDGFVAKL